MGYVGVPPQSGFITTAKQRVTSSTNNYVDLDHSISSLADVIVWVNFVKQDSTNLSLTSSTRITLGATLVASDIVEIAYLGKAVATQTPSSGSVTNDMLATPTTINTNADNRVITGSGTANTLNGEANLTFTGGILTSQTDANEQDAILIKQSDGTDVGSLRLNNGSFLLKGKNSSSPVQIQTHDGNEDIEVDPDGFIKFETGGSERMRVTGDTLIVSKNNNYTDNGTGGGSGIKLADIGGTRGEIGVEKTGTSASGMIYFYNGNGGVGSIITDGSSTSYGTSSDYRLKENAVAISDGITRLKTLKPYRFNFKADADTTVDGFFAHEVTAVPEAITGEKDAMAVETRYTSDDVETQGDNPSKNVGDPKTYSTTEIDAQGIDQSKLVPLLTSALQEAITKIETLEARVQTLENA